MPKEITSLQHPLVKHIVKLRQSSSYRSSEKSIVIEGIKPVCEACCHLKAKSLLVTSEKLIPNDLQCDNVYIVSEAVMAKASGMVHSEGILVEMQMPENSSLKGMRSILVLESINDPGNLGTLLRTALGLGWEGVFLVGSGCDLYNEKALRAARGTSLMIPCCRGTWQELKVLAEQNNLYPYVADLDGKKPTKQESSKGVILILSNEARGPSEEALQWCEKVSIPLTPSTESLNVAIAGAILMYALRPDAVNP